MEKNELKQAFIFKKDHMAKLANAHPRDLGSNLGTDKIFFYFVFVALEFKSVGC
jgi:hypothetical protein